MKKIESGRSFADDRCSDGGEHVQSLFSSTSSFARNTRPNLIYAVLLILFLGLVYYPSLSFPFLNGWDDGAFIVFNPRLAFTWDNLLYYGLEPFQELYTPLPMYSFMIDWTLFGLDPLGYRLHNLLLHFVGC